ncbi:hypothetical protein Hanom_Chr11g01002811 [Helianthus anomalus]
MLFCNTTDFQVYWKKISLMRKSLLGCGYSLRSSTSTSISTLGISFLLLSLRLSVVLFSSMISVFPELCGGGAILQLLQNTLKLPEHDDPLLASVVDRLKSKVLCIASPIVCRRYLHKGMFLLFQGLCLNVFFFKK